MRKIFTFHNNNNTKIKRLEYLSPSFVFIPITNKIAKAIKIEDKVLKGEYFNKTDYSTISGIIKGSKECKVINKRVKTIAIKNNFKEQRVKKNLKDFYKEHLDINIINKLNKGKENLVFTCFIDEPSVYNVRYYIGDYSHELLDTLDFLKKEYNYKNIYIIINDQEKNSIEKFIKIIGNYPEIRFITIPNVYPVNNTDYVENNLNIKNSTVLSFYELYKIYYLINFRKMYEEIFLTINIDDKTSIVVKTKIGVLLEELLSNIKVKYQDYNIYLNGLISGKKVLSIKDEIVTDKLYSIYLTKKEKHIPLKCINCGNCYKYCPANINPKKVLEGKLSKEEKNKCLNCGLCNYICPSFICLKEKIEEEEREITQ